MALVTSPRWWKGSRQKLNTSGFTTYTAEELAASAPAPLVLENARSEISRQALAGEKWLVVLDDDPTGSQSVQNIPVVTSWTSEDLRWAFAHPSKAFFILTNSRSMDNDEARELLSDVIRSVEETAESMQISYSFVMRTDSTLRGHFDLESTLLLDHAAQAGHPYDLMIFVPAYLDAGRMTVDDVHLVKAGEHFVPVARTDYAKDTAFHFESSNLRDYVQERTQNRILASEVSSISLSEIRLGGPEAVENKLLAARAGEIFVVNATEESDLDIVALASLRAEQKGKRVLYRTGPSFVAARLGLKGRPPLTYAEIFQDHNRTGHGLIVVGSHVDITTKQLQEVSRRSDNLTTIEVEVSRLLDSQTAREEIDRCANSAIHELQRNEVLIATSRKVISGATGSESLNISKLISDALVEITKRALKESKVLWLIAKGGITSSDILTKAVEARRAVVAGQLFPGIVSVWVNEGQHNPALTGLPLVVFAGNVGDEGSLAEAIEILRGALN